MNNVAPIGVTMGDPAGIGPEILLKALAAMPRFRPVIFGSRAVLGKEQRRLGTNVDLSIVQDCAPKLGRYQLGRPQKNCGEAAFACLEAGVTALRQRTIAALVTAPVSKEALRLAGFRWPGQTEFLADRLGARHTAMLAWTPRFKAVFVTIHLPLTQVSRRLTPDAVAEKARLLHEFLQAELGRKPRICCLAFNPHGYEFTRGEEERIAAGVNLARQAGIDAVGPIPADAAIASLAYDGFVAMYHEQAMIPAKLLARGQGVNVTLGLGRIRTSPLHGTAFDIAGQGIASLSSMLAAIRLARRLAR